MTFNFEDLFNQNRTVTEPSADLRVMARANWQFYQAHIQEGFSESQAMTILLTVMQSVMFNPDSGNGEEDGNP